MTADVRFIINSQIETAEELIEWIDLEPEEHWSKGEIRPGGPRRGYRNTGVIYYPTFEVDERVDIVLQVRALLDRLEPSRERLLALKQRCEFEGIEVKYRIAYFLHVPFATVAWLEFSQVDLTRIALFGSAIECEYIWGSHTADPLQVWDEDPDRGFFDEDQWRWIHKSELVVEEGVE